MKELTIPEAEAMAGERLDRRRRYAEPPGGAPCADTGVKVYCSLRYSKACTGCTVFGMGIETKIGLGCSECGYTGRRRESVWVPHVKNEIKGKRS